MILSIDNKSKWTLYADELGEKVFKQHFVNMETQTPTQPNLIYRGKDKYTERGPTQVGIKKKVFGPT